MIWKKKFFKLMNKSVFGKTMASIKKHSDIKFVTTKKEETIWYLNLIIQQSFSQYQSNSNRNEKHTNIQE